MRSSPPITTALIDLHSDSPLSCEMGVVFCSFHGFLCSSPPSAVFRLPDPHCPAAFSRLPVRCLSPLYPSDFTIFCMALPLPPMTVQKIHCGGRNQPFCMSLEQRIFQPFSNAVRGGRSSAPNRIPALLPLGQTKKTSFSAGLFRSCTEDGLLSYHIRPIAVRISRIRIMPRAASNSGIRNMSSVYFLLVSVTSTIRA